MLVWLPPPLVPSTQMTSRVGVVDTICHRDGDILIQSPTVVSNMGAEDDNLRRTYCLAEPLVHKSSMTGAMQLPHRRSILPRDMAADWHGFGGPKDQGRIFVCAFVHVGNCARFMHVKRT